MASVINCLYTNKHYTMQKGTIKIIMMIITVVMVMIIIIIIMTIIMMIINSRIRTKKLKIYPRTYDR